jgi:hypothetical protein
MRWLRPFKTQTADYLSRPDAGTLSNPEVDELGARPAVELLCPRAVAKVSRESASGEPGFRLWHAAAEIPD